jgi:ASCH domain
MRALSVKQPWAQLICDGRKSLEIRTWTTPYRGPLIVVASLQWARDDEDAIVWKDVDGERGALVCLVTLEDVRHAAQDGSDDGAACCALPRRGAAPFAWVLRDPVPLRPVKCRGALGLYKLQPGVSIITLDGRAVDEAPGPQASRL